MRARLYNKRIDIYVVSSVSDGAGGFIKDADVLIGSSWAKIDTFKVPSANQNASDVALKHETANALKVTLRKRNDLSYNSFADYIIYRGVKYTVKTDPTNINFYDTTIQFVVERAVFKGTQVENIYPLYNARVNTADGVLASAQCTNDYINSLV